MTFDTYTMTPAEIQAALWEDFKKTYPDFKYDSEAGKPDERLITFLNYQIINHLGGFHRNLLDNLLDPINPESFAVIQMKSAGYLYMYMTCFAASHGWTKWYPDDFLTTMTMSAPEVIISFRNYDFRGRWNALNTLVKHHDIDPEECFRDMAHRILNSDGHPVYHFEGTLK